MRPSLTITEATALIAAAELQQKSLEIGAMKAQKLNRLSEALDMSLQYLYLGTAIGKLRSALEAETKTGKEK
jgi:hypothetical protein